MASARQAILGEWNSLLPLREMKLSMTRLKKIALILIAAAFANSFEVVAGANETSKSMHGIKLADYGDFEKKWKLVTVRFRKDTGELRFTYANGLAWKHLKKLSEKENSPPGSVEKMPIESYPRGAVFAKVGIKTADDPAFVSSAVPSGVRRVQFMVRDEKKFAETDGWGYALFDSAGSTFPGDLKQASMACAACHKIVPDRGYVFSQFMTGLAPAKSQEAPKEKSAGGELGRIKFETKAAGSLPEHVQIQLPPKTEVVRMVVGEITKHVFPGTLDEIRPALTQEAVRSGNPTILFSQQKDSVYYSIVYSTKTRGSCADGQTEFLGVMNTTEKSTTTQNIRFCESEKK